MVAVLLLLFGDLVHYWSPIGMFIFHCLCAESKAKTSNVDSSSFASTMLDTWMPAQVLNVVPNSRGESTDSGSGSLFLTVFIDCSPTVAKGFEVRFPALPRAVQ